MAEPLSVLVHASRRAALSAGQTVLVYGVGTIGLLACALAKSRGCSRIVAVDINQTRLSFAKTHGFAEDVFCLSASPKVKLPEEQLRRAKESGDQLLEAFGEDDGFDVVFECTGAESCIQMAIHVRDFSPCSPVITSTDVVLGTFIHTDGDHWRTSDARRNGNPQHFSPTLSGSTARSGHPRFLPLRKHLPRSTCTSRFRQVTKS